MTIQRPTPALLAALVLSLACTQRAPAEGHAVGAASHEGRDFGADARLLYLVAACGADEAEPLPESLDAAVVKEHCDWLLPRIERYRRDYRDVAQKFIAKRRPGGLPATLVYPFGGGDLLSALTTYPDAREITTLSLEHAGDLRRLREMDKPRLAKSLGLLRKSIAGLLCCNDSTSESLMRMERADLPGQLSFFMVGLAVHGFEPVSLRYFSLEPDGTLHYLSAEEIAALEKSTARKLNHAWISPDFSEAFSNAELSFRARGGKDELRVHRHIAANLSDPSLGKDDRVLKHLAAKGPISAMTKAASYLLWNPAFVKMRSYLLAHMVFMVSDSTGIPPRFAKKAGFVQETYGKFSGPFLEASPQYSEEFVRLWAEEPYRPLPFRYGYPEAGKQWHMLITRKPPLKAEAAKK